MAGAKVSPRPDDSKAELRPPRAVVRGSSGNWALQAALDRRGLGPVAGVDEAGRGACAGPLVVAACVLRPGDTRRFEGLTDSKLLTAATRDRMYDLVLDRSVAHSVVVVDPAEVDALGIHVVNLEGMRRAVARLSPHPGYVLTDGFRVPGLTAPNMPVIKGDQAVACVAAASVLAKVTRDRIMTELHQRHPRYGFDVHKGYSTAEHSAALRTHGPTDEHRWSYANVVAAAEEHGLTPPRRVKTGLLATARNGVAPVVQNVLVPPGRLAEGAAVSRRGVEGG
ncbi:ribonuclease HII [Crossiella cryophila]|uniref:ribonuclease HII n=1 Tax=Crossiella cryophila TaxID=43355 RepID=UPI00161058F1|nr:ribonuclease HII [Crossiella cryophila]